MHVVKNYLKDRGAFDAHTNVPVILGIWGEKGQGKTFQTELAFKKLGCVTCLTIVRTRKGERKRQLP